MCAPGNAGPEHAVVQCTHLPTFHTAPDCLYYSRAAPPQITGAFKLLRIVRLFKLLRLIRNNLVVEALEGQIAVDYGAVQLVKYMLMLLFLTHWIACGWCVSLRQPARTCGHELSCRTTRVCAERGQPLLWDTARQLGILM